ncbi:MAG: enoyl-CoA hydratase/isomerase family protein [Chloroflexota bacterium]
MIKIEGTAEIPHLLLNRPKQANALNAALLAELTEAVSQAIRSEARAIVLCAEGRGFSAGADLNEVSGQADDVGVDDRIAALTDTIVSAPIPVVVALHGYCMGAAVDVAWACDFVVATPDVRIALPAARLGLLYSPRALQRLHARLGTRVLRRLILFSETLTGEEAWRLGVVERVADAAQLRQEANDVAEGAVQAGPAAIAASKGFLNAADVGPIDFEHWEQQRRTLLASKERQVAVRAKKRTL